MAKKKHRNIFFMAVALIFIALLVFFLRTPEEAKCGVSCMATCMMATPGDIAERVSLCSYGCLEKCRRRD